MMGFGLQELVIIVVLLLLVIGIPVLLFGPIAKKAGFSRWWSLLLVIPLINIITIWVFSFVEWPAESKAT